MHVEVGSWMLLASPVLRGSSSWPVFFLASVGDHCAYPRDGVGSWATPHHPLVLAPSGNEKIAGLLDDAGTDDTAPLLVGVVVDDALCVPREVVP